MPIPLLRSIRASENFHIVLWLGKDISWIMGWKVLGLGMFVPTIAMAVWIAWKCRAELGELLHSMAVVFWILANGVWMVGEFWYADGIRHVALPFFLAGLFCVGWYYLVVLPRAMRRSGRG